MNFKNNPFFSFFIIVVLIVLSSCASTKAARDTRPYAYLTDKSKFFLLPPGDIEKPIDAYQFISASYGGQEFLFNAWVKADETGMDIALFNELGANGGELSYRDGVVSFSSPIFPASMKPEYIVADFQLCYYDSAKLRRALASCGLTLESSETSRKVLKGKTVIVEIEILENSVKLVNHLRGYSYTLEGSLE